MGELDELEVLIVSQNQLSGNIPSELGNLSKLEFLDLGYNYLKRGQVEEVQRYVPRSLEAATAGQMLEYIGMAKANLAWVAQHEGKLSEAQEIGQAAYALLQQVPQGQMFPWVILWPLIGMRLAQNQIAEAIEWARALFTPTGQPVPDTLAVVLEAAIQAWEEDQPEIAPAHLNQAAELVRETGYL